MQDILCSIGLVAARLAPVFLVVPVSSFRRVPVYIRSILILVLALVLTSTLEFQVFYNDLADFTQKFVKEFIIGASLAFSFHAATGALQTMGQLVDLQVGFAAGTVFDPNTEQMISPTGEILTLCLMVVLISLNVHHDILIGISKLFEVLPPGSHIEWNSQWLKILGIHFVLGFIVVSPVILTLWFVDLTLAFISRSMPQAPIYFVGLPVKVFIGIVMLAWFINQALEPLYRMLMQSFESWNLMFEVH
ncbi:hypothetical protein TDB9533_02896 [Thalassocella blandensis]|nr:hypothetical protein TDB9533_02896 [Thalassocella blandensis]